MISFLALISQSWLNSSAKVQPCSCFRLDVTTRIDPEALIGRKLRVYWPDDDGWYLGTVAHYSPQTGQHKVLLCSASVSVTK